MAKTRRRVLSILMALVLTLGLLPTSALAWGETTITVTDPEGYVIEGATVQVSWQSFGQHTKTDKTDPYGRAYFDIGWNNYSYTVTKDGYKSATGSVWYGRDTTVVLERAGSSALPKSVTFNVYRLYKNEIPSNINQSFDASLFGPDGDDTPYFSVTVDMEKLMQIENMGEPEWKNGHWYVSLDTIDYNGNDKADWFWNQVLSCMSSADRAQFDNYFGGLFRGYVLKQESGAAHIDGVLVETPPTYTVELYLNGKVVGTSTQGDGQKHTVSKVYKMWEEALASQYGSGTMDWDTMEYTTASGTVYELTKGAWPMSDREVNYQTLGSSDFNIARFYLTSEKAQTYIVKYEWAAGSAEPVTLPEDSDAMREAELASYELATLPTSSDEEITGWYTDAAHTTLYAAGTALKSLAKNGVITLYAYCAPEGDLTIEKTFTAETEDDLTKLTAANGGFSITVSGPNSYTTTLTTGTTGVVAGDVVTGTGTVSQTYTWTLTDRAIGQYTVSEDHRSAETDYNVTYDQNKQRTVNLTTAGAEVSFTNLYALKKPGVGLTKAVDKTLAKAGETIQYTIGVYNDGTLAANNVIITDVLDENLTLTASLPEGVTYNEATRTITWTVGNVPYGSTADEPFKTIQLSAQISEDAEENTEITNQAIYGTIASNTVTTKVIDSNLSIEKVVLDANGNPCTGTPVVAPGDTVTFQITVTNSGFAAAEDVEVTDTLPGEMTLVADGTTDDYTRVGDSNAYKWTVDVLAATSETDGGGMTTVAPGTTTITVVATVNSDALPEGTYSKTVENAATMNELTAEAEVEISNGEGGLKIVKAFGQGSDLNVSNLDQLAQYISFTVSGENLEENITVTLRDAAASTGKLLDLEPGTYTVTENTTAIDNYSLSTTVKENNGVPQDGQTIEVEVTEGSTKTVTFTNTYTAKIYRVIFDAAATDSAAHDITLGGSVQSYDRYTWLTNRWGVVDTTQAEANTLELIFTKDQIDAVDGYNVGVQAAPGYAWNEQFVLDSDENVTYDSFAAIVADLASRATRDTGVEYLDGSGDMVTGVVWTIRVHAEYDYDLTYTFNDFGSEHVSMAYAVGKEATTLTPVTKFGSAFAPVLVCDQKNLDDPDDFQTVFFFVKADDGYQLGEQYWEASSATALTSVEKSVVGELTELPPIEEFPDDALLAAAHEAGYTHYFSYEENGVVDNVFKADVLNRYFKVVATENPTYTITGTKTVALGGNRAPGSTTFTFNLEGHRIQPVALTTEIGGDVKKITDTATVTINGAGTATFQFDTIEFTQEGWYTFRVTEKDDRANTTYWRYDNTEYWVDIQVIETDDGLKIQSVEMGIPQWENDELIDVKDVDTIAFTNTYTRSGGNNPGPGPGDGDGDGDTDIPDENTPTTDLPDENTPTTDLPDENTPTTETPEETTDLPDEETPLADVPETGDSTGVWVLAAGVSGLALVWLALTGKKRRDENA